MKPTWIVLVLIDRTQDLFELLVAPEKMQNMTCPIETGYTYEGLFICGGLQCGKTQNQKPSQFCQEWSNCAYHGIH